MTRGQKFLDELKNSFLQHEQNLMKFHKNFFAEYHKLLKSSIKPSANRIIQLQPEQRYNEYFFMVQCTKTNQTEVIIQTDTDKIKFPKESFVQGAMYPINISRYTGDVSFVGYCN